MMDSRERAALDRYITGNYGEKQYADECDCTDDPCDKCGGYPDDEPHFDFDEQAKETPRV